MEITNQKLGNIHKKISRGEPVKIMIIGLGSVGNYLLDYLMQWNYANIEIHVCGRNVSKIQTDINIVKVANIIKYNTSKPIFIHELDLNNINSIEKVLKDTQPDFIINTSRVYSGLKYGSISWNNIRAYGLWCPLAVSYIRNVMTAYGNAESSAIVINTSYSDGVNAWLKTAGLSYPDFGSGNLNHLIPRIKMAVLDILNKDISEIDNIDITLCTSHFHDVLISKEGITEGVYPLLNVKYKGQVLEINEDEIYKKCTIPMPVDAKRNMMNASSNFEIISKIILSSKNNSKNKFHSPGVFGLIGGYPVIVDFSNSNNGKFIYIDETYWSLSEMMDINRRSIYLDGVENVIDGQLIWTDELISKVKNKFKCDIPKVVPFNKISDTASMIINDIITPNVG